MSTARADARLDNHASLAAFLSFLFPGLGQAYNGESTLAWMLATPVILLVAVVALALGAASSGVLSQLLDTSFLVGLIVLDLAFLFWRMIAIAQAHARRERLTARRWTTWLTGVLLVATLGMHVLPAYYAAKAIDTINAVALGGSGGRGGANPGGQRPADLPEPSNQPNVVGGERVNVLLVGVDAGPGRSTELTDTMLVVSLDPIGGRSAMISIPRDLYGVPLPDGRIYNAKLNSLMALANTRPAEFPLGGVGTLKATIGELLGVRIHYFAAINLVGFMQAIDSVGGVDVTVTQAIDDPFYNDEITGRRVGFHLPVGTHRMDGRLALAFVRSRRGVGNNDFTRADRQQQLLTALREKLTAGNLLLSLPGLLDAVKNTIATDVPSGRISELAQAVQDADMSQLRRIVLQPPDYMTADPFSAAGYILIPDLEAIRAIGEELLPAPPVTRTPSQ
ncbi:MAG TPA: LCP family protein [Candidatus Dormibacteraeota bacterium]|nr:LCP family protein [Candidatus Dormibacteraeota bacterium]